ncbi:hypothetical protein VP01_9500g1, partial [Puccinia sorghi]
YLRTVQSDKQVMFISSLDRMDIDFPKKSKGKETAGPSVLALGKKKAAELAKRALGVESQVALSLKEGGAGGRRDTDLHTDTVLCPLGYVQICIGDCQVWAMIDSGWSMVNLLPTDLVRDADLVHRQANSRLGGIGGHECKVDGVVEVAKCKRRVSFL